VKRKNGLGIIIGFSILALLSLTIIFNLILDYNSRIKNLKDGYRRLGSSLSQTISMTYSFGDSILYFIEDFIYENMIDEMIQNKKKYLTAENMVFIVDDTISEGFYFSEKQNDEIFKVTLFSGKNVYEITRIKSSMKGTVKSGGIGEYIKNLEWLSSVEYVAIQDINGIITATGNVSKLTTICMDSLLQFSFVEHEEILRLTDFKDEKIYEYVHPIKNTDKILRIGFKNEDIKKALNSQKMALLAGMLMVLLFSLFAFFMFFYYSKALRLSQGIIEKEKDLSNIFKMTKDAIIISRQSSVIMNDSARLIFGKEDNILSNEKIVKIMNDKVQVKNMPIDLNGKKMLLSSIHTNESDQMTIILNDITDLERMKEEKELNERLIMFGDLSFKIAHELKNPLNGISLVLQRISKRDIVSKEEKEMIEDAKNEVERMNRKIVDFMKYVKPIDYDFKNVSIEEIVKLSLEGLKIIADEKKILIEKNVSENHIIKCDIDYIVIAVKNIILNAIEASQERGKIKITSFSLPEKIKLEIEDEGDGIEEKNLNRIFDLYYTTKENGSGVGLANSYKILKDHRADVSVKSEKGKGTKFEIIF